MKSYQWCPLTILPNFKATFGLWQMWRRDSEFRGCMSMRWIIKKMQVVVTATQGFSSAAEAVSFHIRHTGSILPHCPWSKVTQKWQTCFLLPLGIGIQSKSSTFQKQSPASQAFAVIPLFYGFLPPDNIQQNELRATGMWGRVQHKIKQGTDDRDALLLPKQVNAGVSLAWPALCEACTAS